MNLDIAAARDRVAEMEKKLGIEGLGDELEMMPRRARRVFWAERRRGADNTKALVAARRALLR